MSEKQIEETRKKILRIVDGAKIKTLKDWTEDRVEEFCMNLVKKTAAKDFDPKVAEPSTMRTRNFYRSTAHTFDRWLYEKKRQLELAMRGLKKEFNKAYVPSRTRKPLEWDGLVKLWETARDSERTIEGYAGHMRYMLYMTAAATGFRRSELQQLTPESILLDCGEPGITRPGQITKNGDDVDLQNLPDYLVPVFRDWLADKPAGEPLFPDVEKKKTAKMMKRDLTEAGLEYNPEGTNQFYDFHGWRHLFITNAWQGADGNPLVVQVRARHADIKTTMGYSHTNDRQLYVATNKAGRLPVLPSKAK